MTPDDRRRQLLDAALEVIARDGYGGVSIEAIAREAKVTRPVVYGVFDGLAPLLYALLDREEEQALEQLLSALPADPELADPDAFLLAAARRMIEVVRANPLTWRPILSQPEGTPGAVQKRIERDRELVRARIEALLVLGLERRGGAEVDAEIASHALIAVAEHFGRLIVADPEGFDAERLIAAIEGLLAALGPAKGRRQGE